MKIIKEKQLKSGKQVIINLDQDEEILIIRKDSFYRLGYPIEDIIASHIIKDSVEVAWDSFEQKWLD